MERLCKVAGLIFAAACISAGSATPVAAQDYCSLKVRVVTPTGRRHEVLVTVKERNGRSTQKEQNADSQEVLFCDLGILPVTVVIGAQGCNHITVKDVPLSWQKPYTLIVTHDFDACIREELPLPVPVCKILLRVSDPDGKWVKQASVSFSDPNFSELQTDVAGRAIFSLKLNGHLLGSVSAPGYIRKDFSFGCSDQTNLEQILTLERK